MSRTRFNTMPDNCSHACSLLARFFQIMKQKVRVEDELYGYKSGKSVPTRPDEPKKGK